MSPFKPAIAAADARLTRWWASSIEIQNKPTAQLTGAELPLRIVGCLTYTINAPAQLRWAPAPLHGAWAEGASSRSPSLPRSTYTRWVPAP